MLEDLLVQEGNVDDWEHAREASHNREKEEAIAPECGKDGEGRARCGVRIHVEQAPRKVFDFPSGDEEQQCDGSIRCCPCAKHDVASIVVTLVTS